MSQKSTEAPKEEESTNITEDKNTSEVRCQNEDDEHKGKIEVKDEVIKKDNDTEQKEEKNTENHTEDAQQESVEIKKTSLKISKILEEAIIRWDCMPFIQLLFENNPDLKDEDSIKVFRKFVQIYNNLQPGLMIQYDNGVMNVKDMSSLSNCSSVPSISLFSDSLFNSDTIKSELLKHMKSIISIQHVLQRIRYEDYETEKVDIFISSKKNNPEDLVLEFANYDISCCIFGEFKNYQNDITRKKNNNTFTNLVQDKTKRNDKNPQMVWKNENIQPRVNIFHNKQNSNENPEKSALNQKNTQKSELYVRRGYVKGYNPVNPYKSENKTKQFPNQNIQEKQKQKTTSENKKNGPDTTESFTSTNYANSLDIDQFKNTQ